MIQRIAELRQNETAGEPMTELKWTRKTTEKIATALQESGINVGPKTVSRLLTVRGYSLRGNHKILSRVSTTTPKVRNDQFEHIAALRKDFTTRGMPGISVDTKKKELVGHFANHGVAWNRRPVNVNDHDFPSDAIGTAIPYGIYDIQATLGSIFVGHTRDPAEFAVESIEAWWRTEGQHRSPGAKHIALLADGGGSTESTNRAWKPHLSHLFTERHGISVPVAHYPPGASKWNLLEHRLVSQISKNWAGRPLDSYETVLNDIRTTTTSTGLKVTAPLVDRDDETGLKITDGQMRSLPIDWHDSRPKWNYTITPSQN